MVIYFGFKWLLRLRYSSQIQWELKFFKEKKIYIYIKVGKHSRVGAVSELVSESNELQSRGVTGQEGLLCFFLFGGGFY